MNGFDNIIGYTAVKQDLEQICDALRHPEVYAKLGASTPHGLLLYGEPGVGKTLMATSLIAASGRPAFTCRKDQSGSDFLKSIRDTFDKAKENAPSIVFLDDLDKFSNCDIDLPDAEEYVTVQSCIDELKGCEVFVLATANNKRKLPHSLLRAGRFDRVMEITAPHGADAEKIIKHYLKGKEFVGDIDTKLIARMMDGRSCAELETVINAAAVYAGAERADCITEQHFIEACLKTCFAVSAKSNDEDDLDWHLRRLPPQKERRSQAVACHEAGHTVIAEVLCPGSVTLSTIRGDNTHFGGFTLFYKDESVDDFAWMECEIISMLGGKAALEQKYGVLDLGSSADLESAFDTVKELVRSCCLCGFHLRGTGYQNSQAALAHQEQAVAAEIEKYYRKAKEILAANRDFFECVEKELIEKGLLTGKDLQRIRGECDSDALAG